MSIDPKAVTNFSRTRAELELFWIFCVCVAGKNADQTASKVGNMFRRCLTKNDTPFTYLKDNQHAIHNLLVANRIGQYGRIESAIMDSLELDLADCTLDELMNCRGVGPKTARFFLVHTRKDADYVVLDTHILKWLRTKYDSEYPKSTPSGQEYVRIENIARMLFKTEFLDATMAEIDLLIWAKMSGRLQ